MINGKGTVIFRVVDMTKTFGPVTALDNVSITIRRGQIVGLIGENGSGKSTVSSIIAGMQRADSGRMTFRERAWEPASMLDALEHGLGMIVQESGAIPGITVAENIFLGNTAQFKTRGLISHKKMNEAANAVLEQIGETRIKGSMPMGALDFQERKIVEIAKVFMKEPEILIVDETTTALSQQGREIIYNLMRNMRDDNKSVLFISHDLDEIMSVCDSLTVLRDGKIIRTFEKDEYDENAIKTSMIGRELQGDYYRGDYDGSFGERVAVSVRGVTSAAGLKDINIDIHEGEILGIGGLSHCGMHTLGKVLFGAMKPDTGTVQIGMASVKNERVAMKNKIGYVSKDRDVESINLTASIKDNIAIGGLEQIKTGGFLVTWPRENKYVDRQIVGVSVKCVDRNQGVSQLSGGNKQKVVFGKWVGRDSDVLILDCPTRGIDIGVKQAMYRLMADLKNAGKSIVLISEELPELLGMCDRLLIMKDGEIKKEFTRSPGNTEADIVRYMI
jgi:ribose transport system ATP-binding protein